MGGNDILTRSKNFSFFLFPSETKIDWVKPAFLREENGRTPPVTAVIRTLSASSIDTHIYIYIKHSPMPLVSK